MHKQIKWLILSAAIAACVLFGYRLLRAPDQVQTAQEVKLSVRLKWLLFSNYSGAVVAKEKGFFPENWQVDIRTGGFEADSIKMVASGSDDFGITSALELARARMQGIPLVALCADFQDTPVSFLTLPESAIAKWEDVRGKKIGVKYGTDIELVYWALLRKFGMKSADVVEVPVKFTTLPLTEKQVDVFPSYAMTDPVNLESAGVKVNMINPPDYGIHIYGNVLFTTEQTIATRPELVRDFVAAYVRGWKWAVSNPDETGAIFQRLNDKVPAANQVTILKRTMPYLVVNGSMDAFGQMTQEKWTDTLNVLEGDPQITAKVDFKQLDVSAFFSDKYLR